MDNTLFPIIVPRIYNEQGNWVGPILNLNHPELGVTWVHLHEPGAMTYVSYDDVKNYENQGIDIHMKAMYNLLESSMKMPLTHDRHEGNEIVMGIMLHDDGLGSSRLLLVEEYQEIFPQGYEFGIPERSFGCIVPTGIKEEYYNDALQMIEKTYEDGPTSMLPGLHSSSLFQLESG